MADNTTSAVNLGLVRAMYGAIGESSFVRGFERVVGLIVCASVQENALAAKSSTGGLPMSLLSALGVGNGVVVGNDATGAAAIGPASAATGRSGLILLLLFFVVDVNVERKVLDTKSGIVLGAVDVAELASRAEVDEKRLRLRLFSDPNDLRPLFKTSLNDFCCDSVTRAEETLYSNMGARRSSRKDNVLMRMVEKEEEKKKFTLGKLVIG
jgi:hypothetical protein